MRSSSTIPTCSWPVISSGIPSRGNLNIRSAPDVMVVFGRPKRDRGSYMQWEEDGIAPQVVFEVLSPGNRAGAMERKFQFYERHGVEEYYIYDPDRGDLVGWRRADEYWKRSPKWPASRVPGSKSASSQATDQTTSRSSAPDGEPFLTYAELVKQRNADRQRAEEARPTCRRTTRRPPGRAAARAGLEAGLRPLP